MAGRRTSFKLLICHCLFWTKALLATWLAIGGFFLFSWKIYYLHLYPELGLPFTGNPRIAFPGSTSGSGGWNGGTSCNADSSGRARLEPAENKILFGFSLDFRFDRPTTIQRKLNGFRAGIINVFMDLDLNRWPVVGYDVDMLSWFADQVHRTGGILELTMQPTAELDSVPDSVYDDLAKHCRRINEDHGVPIFLRFGHEMNGDWATYGNKPSAYIRNFRRLTSFIRKYTNVTAMVWGPNVALTYPFGGRSPTVSAVDLKLLDTNNNGIIDNNDDPYGPFYPGDDVVDWVALSLYYYPFDPMRNQPIEDEYFWQYMDAEGPLMDRLSSNRNSTWTYVHNFYKRFSEEKGKPMMLPETAAPFLMDVQNSIASELTIKSAWWNQMLSEKTYSKYPNLKAIVYFEEEKLSNGHIFNWYVTNTSTIANALSEKISESRNHIISGDMMRYDCSGTITLV